MDNLDKLCEVMYDQQNSVMIDLRLGKGLNYKKVEEMKNILKLLIDEWIDKEFVPKKMCDLFIDFYPGIEACSYSYDAETQKRILEIANEILDLMRNCVCC